MSSTIVGVLAVLAPLAIGACERAPAPDELLLHSAGGFDPPTGAVVLDVRDRAAFESGHVAGARWLDPGALRATVDGVEGQVASRELVEQRLGEVGLAADDEVVIVGADNGTDPARVAWTLRYFGHRGAVGLLDGGMQAWAEAGQSVVTNEAQPPSQRYDGGETRDDLRVDQAWMLEHLDRDDVVIFDVRTPQEYAEGHVPGAINVNWTLTLAADGSFLDAAQVRRLHGDPAPTSTLVVYCRTGSRAAVSWARLLQAGYDDVRLYDGSWAEWGSDPATPKA